MLGALCKIAHTFKLMFVARGERATLHTVLRMATEYDVRGSSEMNERE